MVSVVCTSAVQHNKQTPVMRLPLPVLLLIPTAWSLPLHLQTDTGDLQPVSVDSQEGSIEDVENIQLYFRLLRDREEYINSLSKQREEIEYMNSLSNERGEIEYMDYLSNLREEEEYKQKEEIKYMDSISMLDEENKYKQRGEIEYMDAITILKEEDEYKQTGEIEYMDYLSNAREEYEYKQEEEMSVLDSISMLKEEYLASLSKQSRYAHLKLMAHLGPVGSLGLAGGLGPGLTGLGAGAQLGQLGAGAAAGVAGPGLYLTAGAGLGSNYLDFVHHYNQPQSSHSHLLRNSPSPSPLGYLLFGRGQVQHPYYPGENLFLRSL